MIQIRLCDGQFVMLAPGDTLTVTSGDENVQFPLADVEEFRCGNAELRVLSGRHVSLGEVRVLAFADPDTGILVTSPPLHDEGVAALAEELTGRPKVQTYQGLPPDLRT